MEMPLCDVLDQQIFLIKEALTASQDVREKIVNIEKEKNELFEKYCKLKLDFEKLKTEKCTHCSVLTEQLNSMKKEKALIKKQEKARLLKSIAKSLESLEEGNTHQLTNAQHIFTQLVSGGLDDSGETEEKTSHVNNNITLIQEHGDSNDNTIQDSKVLVNDTIVEVENDELNQEKFCSMSPIVVEETEGMFKQNNLRSVKPLSSSTFIPSIKKLPATSKENWLSSEDEVEILPQNKKLKTSPVLSGSRSRSRTPDALSVCARKEETVKPSMSNNSESNSPSVLSEIINIAESSSSSRANANASDEEVSVWKLKPSVSVESVGGGRRMKQTTLSLARPQRRLDISQCEGFSGGTADNNDEVLPSPQPPRKHVHRNKVGSNVDSLEDPDLTVFNPGVTSTCLPSISADNSFDRLPKVKKSPPYKYRRETVRKKDERNKLPGQECDHCVEYYQATGLTDGKDLKARINTCSRHRDKYSVRANTPPGFWNPVFDDTLE